MVLDRIAVAGQQAAPLPRSLSVQRFAALRRKIYLALLLVSVAADLLILAVRSSSGELDPYSAAILPVAGGWYGLLAVWLWLRPRALRFVEVLLYVSISAVMLAWIIYALNGNIQIFDLASELSGMAWLPAISLLAFIMFERRVALAAAGSLQLGLLAIGLPAMLRWGMAGENLNVIYILSQNFGANIALIPLLLVFTWMREQSLRAGELAETLHQLEHAHAELKQTQAQLVQSEKMRALGQMIAGVAHEINNPAAFVANNLDHLARLTPGLRALYDAYAPLKARATAGEQAAIEAAEDEAEVPYLWDDLPDLVAESQEGLSRIRAIVASLRNFARLDEADMKEADLNEGMRSTLRMVRPLCRGRVTLVEEYGELPPIMCQPGQLNQVFLNLLTNALQAIEGQGQIEVSTRHTAGQIVIAIHDSGAGMDAATLARLGEPFFTTKPIGVGTGLGLAVSFGIVERHGGRLRFTSAPGQGTTAIVELPLARASTEALPVAL